MGTFNDPCALFAQVAPKYLTYQQTKMLTKKQTFFSKLSDGNEFVEHKN
jgi:hypothetical protein